MGTANTDTDRDFPGETASDRQRRISWEAERIAEARARVAAARLVDSATVKVWIDSLGTDRKLPVPYAQG